MLAPRMTLVHDVDAVPAGLLDDPLAYLFAEHWRQRQFCRALEDIAGMPSVAPALLRRMARFLAEDWALHLADEEEDLFHLLRECAASEDEISRVLGVLSADHDGDRLRVRAVRVGLEQAAQAGVGPAAVPGLSDTITLFVSHMMRHIALENAIVLPIARLRLTPLHQARLADAMRARRAA
jgi:iron-sulfur cluster repair protein YtfE (RIC family)